VIEPPAFAVARGSPDVESFIARMEPLCASTARLAPEVHLFHFRQAVRGLAPEEPLELTKDDREALA
jgi:hypothetical protein